MKTSFSIILETENLGMAGLDDLKDTITSLEKQTYPFREAKEFIIVESGHVAPETLDLLKKTYPWITVHQVNHRLEYIEAKRVGAEVATGEIVVFIDSDMYYGPTWLENILAGFEKAPGTSIVGGDTRIRGSSVYATAVQLMWMMDMQSQREYFYPTKTLYLSNFAIKRDVMLLTSSFVGLPIYRAINVEILKQLGFVGYTAVRAPHAIGYHLPPGNLSDFFFRAVICGADAVAKADFYFLPGGKVIEKFSPFRRLWRVPLFIGFKVAVLLRRTVILLKERPVAIMKVILSLFIIVPFLLLYLLGSVVALFNRNYLFNKITAREQAHVV